MSNVEERFMLFEQARITAEANYAENPLDADNLTRLGGILLELAQFKNGSESTQMIQDAIQKLEAVLLINPEKHDAIWCLGNAHTYKALVIPDLNEAEPYFNKAAEYYKQAHELAPEVEHYKQSLEMAPMAHNLHAEIHKHGSAQQATESGPSASTTTKEQRAAKSNTSDLTYDLCGWMFLAIGIYTWLRFSR